VELAQRDYRSSCEHAIRAGELLIEAKAALRHGEWLPWLSSNFRGSPRSAQTHMRLARHPNAKQLAHLGVEAALSLIADATDKPTARRRQPPPHGESELSRLAHVAQNDARGLDEGALAPLVAALTDPERRRLLADLSQATAKLDAIAKRIKRPRQPRRHRQPDEKKNATVVELKPRR
jgi:hypothetical protein